MSEPKCCQLCHSNMKKGQGCNGYLKCYAWRSWFEKEWEGIRQSVEGVKMVREMKEPKFYNSTNLPDGPVEVRMSERGYGRLHHLIESTKTEIREAIASNYRAIQIREEEIKVNRYEDSFCEYCRGKIDALRGILEYIEERSEE